MDDGTAGRRSAAVVRLEPRQLGLGEVFYRTSDAIVVAEAASGRIVLWNGAAAELFGHDDEQAIGLLVEDLVPSSLKMRHRAGMQAYAKGEVGELITTSSKLELPALHRDGSELWVEMSLTPLDAGLPGRYAMAIVRNITERRRLEAELAEAQQLLVTTVAELERRTQELTRINVLGDRLHGCSTIDEAAEVVGAATLDLFPSLSGALYVTVEGDRFEQRARWGAGVIDETVFAPAVCRAVVDGGMQRSGRDELRCTHVPTAVSSVCIPVSADDETLGVLHLRAADGEVPEAMAEAGATVANHVGLALSSIRLRESLREQSIRDPLTNLFNRRYLDEVLDREVRRAARHGLNLTVLAIDIDHFKSFNDVHGHQAGDGLLCAIGAYLQANVRGEDVVCRTGGEEFIVVLPLTALADAVTRAEQLRASVAQLIDRSGRSVTISIGIAAFPVHATTARGLLRVADVALYRAKAGGRDRVEVATI